MKSAKIIYDIIWMIIAILLASFLTVVFDLHEWLIQYTRPFESWELDEIPFFLFFVALSLCLVCLSTLPRIDHGDRRSQADPEGAYGQ